MKQAFRILTLTLLFGANGPVAQANEKLRTLWPGWYLTTQTNQGIQLLYWFNEDGGVAFSNMVHGINQGIISGACVMQLDAFVCDYLEADSNSIAFTIRYTPANDYTAVQPSGDGLLACRVTEQAALQVLEGRNVRGCY